MTNPRIIRECPGCGSKYETYNKKDGSPHREYCCMDCSNRSRAAKASAALWEQNRASGDMRSPRMKAVITAEDYIALKRSPKPLCKCGCGVMVSRRDRQYIRGHWGKGNTKTYNTGVQTGEWPINRTSQRRIVMEMRKACQHCGWNEDLGILVIHHVDHNPFNGNPENILLLCPNCHTKLHKQLKTGWFKEENPKCRKPIAPSQ